MEKGVLGHNIDGTGDYILAWIWAFQKSLGQMGWTYYLYFDREEVANSVLESYVKTGFPNDEYKVKKKTGSKDIVSK